MSTIINRNGILHLTDNTNGETVVAMAKKVTADKVVDENGTKYIRFPDDSLMALVDQKPRKGQRMDLDDAKVGTPVTICVGTDRYPGTVTEVYGPREIRVQWDNWKVTANDGPVATATKVLRDENGKYSIFTLRKNGRIVEKGVDLNGIPSLYVGKADAYQDPHF